ncbi:MAG: ligase-associated DNA damage response DEXH box helicase [Pirellulales bacterium]
MTPASETTLPQRQLPSGKHRSSRNKNAPTPKPVVEMATLGVTCEQWFKNRNQTPFDFQRETWQAMGAGRNGLLHAPTGTGKTLAAWFGALCRSSALPTHDMKTGIRIIWITPLRALATDTARALEEPLVDLTEMLGSHWQVGTRTGDTSAADRRRLRQNWPEALITTPESLSILLSLEDSHDIFADLDTVIVDEWHELLGTKRGVQTELALSRLRAIRPGMITWGLSATLANLDEAVATLVGPTCDHAQLIQADAPRKLEFSTIIPDPIERFPWAGHMGLRLLPQVVEAIESAKTTLAFTNTRSQAERWYDAIQEARPDWKDKLALHHGSVDRELRNTAEAGLRDGSLKCVVATSSLDLGVDFGPVEQVLQIGSPKGIARILQRAGRSGHAPGAVGRLICIPTHALELIECAAARLAASAGSVEPRRPLTNALDCLSQHIVTVACSGGFREHDLYKEVKETVAFANLDDQSWQWALDFAARGGHALSAYPDYCRIKERFGRWYIASPALARRHRMNIGTITSNATVEVKWCRGGRLGTVEESFISRLNTGDRFLFAGRPLTLFRFDGLTAWVKRSRGSHGLQVPRWNGGRMPLSTLLSAAVLEQVRLAGESRQDSSAPPLPPETAAIAPLIATQVTWSRLPTDDTLLIERARSRDGHHLFIFPFEGRLVHEGLAALLAWRIANNTPSTLTLAANDWGFELSGAKQLKLDARDFRQLFKPGQLLEDLFACLNGTEMAKRQFREIARVAGLIQGGTRSAKQTQASAGLIFDVLSEYDTENLLLEQARREVLENQFEFQRLSESLHAIAKKEIVVVDTPRLSPLAFPIWAEQIQSRLTTQNWRQRIMQMAEELEHAARI